MSRRGERTRAEILDAARALLVERDYHGVGMEDIARAAGVSRQTVYLHFGSKAELLLALVRRADETADLEAVLLPYRAARSALAALDAAVAVQGVMEPRIHDIARVLDAARRSDPAAEAAWQDRAGSRWRAYAALAQRLADEGMLAAGWSVDDAADAIGALLSIHSYEYLMVERGWSVEHYVRHMRAILRRALTTATDERRSTDAALPES